MTYRQRNQTLRYQRALKLLTGNGVTYLRSHY